VIEQAWTNAQVGIAAGLCLTTLLTALADGYTTMVGTQHGDVEKNPLMKWLFAKLGQQLTLFLTTGAVLFTGAIVLSHSRVAGYTYFGAMTTVRGIRAFLNYRLLKKQKISLK
jgi:hypothetical protein